MKVQELIDKLNEAVESDPGRAEMEVTVTMGHWKAHAGEGFNGTAFAFDKDRVCLIATREAAGFWKERG